MIWAIVLAGSSNEGSLKDCSDASNEALIKIGSKVMLEYVVDALVQSKEIDKILIVGPKVDLDKIYGQSASILTVDSGSTIVESLQKGIQLIDNSHRGRVLVVTSDIPLITGKIIDDFLKQCQNEKADVIYPIVAKSHNDQKFPGVKRTYVKLKDGIFTGGNIFLINPAIVDQCAQVAEKIVSLRKSPLKLINFIGLRYIFKYFLGTMSIGDAEARVSELLNIQAKSMEVVHPEIGVDVDKPSDLELARKILVSRT